ncbi:MAG: iron hydrogenase small subunit [Spirochaetales bacterium]|nr:iron hydrogenase small subunit [Spirochaetales bacterium]
MITVTINDRGQNAEHNETILQVAKRSGVSIPTLCHMEGLPPSGACRLCVVEDCRTGRLVPACSTKVADEMKIRTHSPKVIRARKTIIELLLASHPDDCLYCVRQGNCELSRLAREYGIRRNGPGKVLPKKRLDVSGLAVTRDNGKCILCGKCVRVCEEVQGIGSIDFVRRGSKTEILCAFGDSINTSSCINCGQCIMVCPTGALSERRQLEEVMDALSRGDTFVVFQHAPSISVTVAEAYGYKPGTDICGKLTTALRKTGGDRVFETSFAADLTVMEEASELVRRIRTGGPLPMMTSCSPGWIKYVEQRYPEFIPNLSTCKSPQGMLGALVKDRYAKKEGIPPECIFHVALMPCTAKKFEAGRPELSAGGLPDIDAVLTTRELIDLFNIYGINPAEMPDGTADKPFGTRSSSGKLFGTSGGVAEAALRTAGFLLTGSDCVDTEIKALRMGAYRKEMRVTIGETTLGVCAVSGINEAGAVLEELKAGRDDLHFIEVMTCPGGCIAGGGQPFGTDKKAVAARVQNLYAIDRNESLRYAHHNPDIALLYDEYLGAPLSEESHRLLHTHYIRREVVS